MAKATFHCRFAAIITMVILAFAWLGYRLFCIQVIRHTELAGKARAFDNTTSVLAAWRGIIYDRNGLVLAISYPAKTVYLNAALLKNDVEQIARTCSPILRVPQQELADAFRAQLHKAEIGTNTMPPPLLVRRNVSVGEWSAMAGALTLENFGFDKPNLSPAQRARLYQLRHKLLFAEDSQIRYYPYGEALCHLLGFTLPQRDGSGLVGQCGIERSLNLYLAGIPGLCASERDATGRELPDRRTEFRAPTNGDNVVLTVDVRLQQIVAQYLQTACQQSHARGASAIVMNSVTGEILAAAAVPNFDPQNPGAFPPETWRNPPFMDNQEPGSTFKLVTLAAALDQKGLTLDTGVYCEHGKYVVDHVSISDHAAFDLLTLRDCFAKSSNIGFAKTALALGPRLFHDYATNFGFGRRTGIPLVAEAAGYIVPLRELSTMNLTRAAFGQGISVTQLQMAAAMGSIANAGKLIRPMLISRIESPQGRVLQRFQPCVVRTVMSRAAAQAGNEALQAVAAPGGTGTLAAMADFTVAIKTGTAQKSDKHGYLKGKYYSSVAGFFPATSPRVVIVVALDEPDNGYYAGQVVAPVFRSIAEQAAVRLNIPPDKTLRVQPAPIQALARVAQR
jgi:cell division protein FtsI/penicillin-binding protein 2